MSQLQRTFDSFFPKHTDYEKDSENLLELVSEHIQDEKPGYLFKHLGSEIPLFIRKDQLLSQSIEHNTQYHFMGFVENSAVAVLEKRA